MFPNKSKNFLKLGIMRLQVEFDFISIIFSSLVASGGENRAPQHVERSTMYHKINEKVFK